MRDFPANRSFLTSSACSKASLAVKAPFIIWSSATGWISEATSINSRTSHEPGRMHCFSFAHFGAMAARFLNLFGILWRKKNYWKCAGRLWSYSPTPCRSEEHTSELQSLMRISYAVFCLKKKTEIEHYQAQ